MKPTRREFVIASTCAICAISARAEPWLGSSRAAASATAAPFLLEGDPYTAHVDDHGLGGRTWDDAFDHALRFRSSSEERDRYVLGWEV